MTNKSPRLKTISEFKLVGVQYGDEQLKLDRIALSSVAKALVVIRGKQEEKDVASEVEKTTLPKTKKGGKDV